MGDFNHDDFQSVEDTSVFTEQSVYVSGSSDANKTRYLEETVDREAIAEPDIYIPVESESNDKQDFQEAMQNIVDSTMSKGTSIEIDMNCASESVRDNMESRMDWSESATKNVTQNPTNVLEGPDNLGNKMITVESTVDYVESSSNTISSHLDKMDCTGLNSIEDTAKLSNDNTGPAVASMTNIDSVDSSSEWTNIIDKTISASDGTNTDFTEINTTSQLCHTYKKNNSEDTEPDTSVDPVSKCSENNQMDCSQDSLTDIQQVSEISINENSADNPVDKTCDDPFKNTVQSSEEITSEKSCTNITPEVELFSKELDTIHNAAISSTTEQSESQKTNTPEEQTDTSSSDPKSSTQDASEEPNSANTDVTVNADDKISNKEVVYSETCETVNNEEGADEELCIIPDMEREISQAEKEAASNIPPLRDPTEAATSDDHINTVLPNSLQKDSLDEITVYKCEQDELQICNQCKLKRKMKYYYDELSSVKYLCDEKCLNIFKNSKPDKVRLNCEDGNLRVKNFCEGARKCAVCKKSTSNGDSNLTWEFLDFCDESCLLKYQKEIGARCSTCRIDVKTNCLGKYCVRFGDAIKQFCSNGCLDKYKKGVKVCAFCQKDISNGPAGFLAPVGDRGNFKDFCSHACIEKYDISTNKRPPKVPAGTICAVCKLAKQITIEFSIDGTQNFFCSEPCLKAFSFVRNISSGICQTCQKHHLKEVLEKHSVYLDNAQYSFCSANCENLYIIAQRRIVPCSWCKVKKYNFDMIRRYSKNGVVLNMCSVHCLRLYTVSFEAMVTLKTVCNFCQKSCNSMYNLTMSDATLRNFCSFNCVVRFQAEFQNQTTQGFPAPVGAPRRTKRTTGTGTTDQAQNEVSHFPISIANLQSLANTNGSVTSSPGIAANISPVNTRSTRSKAINNQSAIITAAQQAVSSIEIPTQVQVKKYFIIKPPAPKDMSNKSTMCYTKKMHKATMSKPTMVDQEIQTDEREASKILIPVPVPIYTPTPMHMYSVPTIVPVPIPIPIPIPIFIPTTRNSAAGIMKEIKKIQVKIPTDPYEAELLMMAEMVAEEKKEDLTDSESDVDDNGGPEESYSPEPVDASNTFGDDMLQMALKMATELDEPAVDLEGALTANTITAPQGAEGHGQEENVDDPQPMHHILDRSPTMRGRKRSMRQSRGGATKRGRRMSHHQVDMPMMQHHQVQQPPPPPEPVEKPDANMCLKYTFGVNAWKQWVTTKNAELEKSSRRVKLFNTEILQLTSDELNYSLCLFVKEVRKPNGAEYAPDTIYYLCLGIQQYLFENGRIDNIFCDPYYEKFTDCLDEVAKKFSVLYNDSHYIVTRVEEEHLWESKQLGAHSPHVLLSTLMFFNTKHFNLTSVDEHMQLSFSHIMKHWKRNPNQPGASKLPGSRNVLLRFYPPQSAIQNNARKKKVYEQQENEENPLRCPVKLYEFYLSKCPESVKTRNDVFYLQPERSCVPDSPVWYSTMPLPKEALEKMLHRVKMVKEINVALLTS